MIATIVRWATEHTRKMLLALIVALPLLALIGGGVEDRLSVGGFLDPDAESTRAAVMLEERFGTGAPNYVLVLSAREGEVMSDANRAEGVRLSEEIAAQPGVIEVTSYYNTPEQPARAHSPLRSADGAHAVLGARLSGSEDAQRKTAEHLHAFTEGNERFDIVATGAVEVSRAAAEQAESDLVRAELLAAPFTLLGLLLIFRGIRAAVLPLIVAVFAVLASFVALTIAVQLTDISIFARTLVTALGLGLAIDYSLLLVARFREELGHGRSVDDAISRTLQTAGRTVVFSAATVGASLVGLLAFPVTYLRSFAFAGVAVVTAASMAALVVIPPLLRLFGHKIGHAESKPDSFWGRQARRVMARPVIWIAGVGLFLVLLGLPFRGFEPGRIDDRSLPADNPARVGADLIRAELSWAEANPITIVSPQGDAFDLDAVEATSQQLLSLEGGPVRVDSSAGFASARGMVPKSSLNERFEPIDGGEGTWFSLLPPSSPESAEVEDLVHRLRSSDLGPDGVLVGGSKAVSIDTVGAVTDNIALALIVIAIVTLILLFFMTGSVLVPIKALVLNLLSLSATFGALVWVFQEGNFADLLNVTATGELDVYTPILMFCVAFGLSMDYEVFLLARIKEEYDLSGDNEEAVAIGIDQTGRIVTAAAVLLAIVFVAIATSGVAIVKMFGVGLALAVITDAFLVRATLTPALMKLAGRTNWWAPRALRRFHLRWGVWETDPIVMPTGQEG